MNAQELKRALEDSVRPTVKTGGKRQSCSSGISTLWSALYQRIFVGLCHTIGILLPVGSRRLRLVQQLLKMPTVYRIHGWQAVWHEVNVALALLLGAPRDIWRAGTRGSGMRLPEFSAKPLKKHRAMVDIIVYGSDAREQLQHCVSQIIAHTTPRYRLIVAVDTASSDTMAYLREIEESQGVVLCEATGASDRAQAVATALHAARAPLWSVASVDARPCRTNLIAYIVRVLHKIIGKLLSKFTRLDVVSTLVIPSVSRLKHLFGHSRATHRNFKPKDRVRGRRHLIELAIKHCVDDCPSVVDCHPLTHTIWTAGPTGINEPCVHAVTFHLLTEQLGIATRMQRHERTTIAR